MGPAPPEQGGAIPKKAARKRRKPKIVVHLQGCGYPIVAKAVKSRAGWRVAEAGEPWDVGWSDTNRVVRELKEMTLRPTLLSPVQRVNHFPNNKQLVRKDLMAENLSLLMNVAPKLFDFAPISWSLPAEKERMFKWVDDEAAIHGPTYERGADVPTYICKPAMGLQGAGIKLVQERAALEALVQRIDEEERGLTRAAAATERTKRQEAAHAAVAEPAGGAVLSAKKRLVVQLYIQRPLTLDGFKFDIRLYVLVTSIRPLKIYLFDNGLCRLCTTKYEAPTKDNLKKTRLHLTNFAVNKTSKNFVAGEHGTKRSLKAVLAQLGKSDADQVWSNTVAVVVKLMIGVAPLMAKSYDSMLPKSHILRTPVSSCFEIYGFDVMIDQDLKVWLIETNHMPSLSGSSPLDSHIKMGVVSGALERLNVTPKRKHTLQARLKKKRQWDMMHQATGRGMQRLGIASCPASPSATIASPLSPIKATNPHARPNKAASNRMLSWTRSSSSSSTNSIPADASAASSRLVGHRRSNSSGSLTSRVSNLIPTLQNAASTSSSQIKTNLSFGESESSMFPSFPSHFTRFKAYKAEPTDDSAPPDSSANRPLMIRSLTMDKSRERPCLSPVSTSTSTPTAAAAAAAANPCYAFKHPTPTTQALPRPSSVPTARTSAAASPPASTTSRAASDDDSLSEASEGDGAECEEEEEEEEEEEAEGYDSDDGGGGSAGEEDTAGEVDAEGSPVRKSAELYARLNLAMDLDVSMATPSFRSPALSDRDQYVLVFSQLNEADCERYAPVMRAAQIAMSEKLERDGGGATTARSDGGEKEEEEEE